MSISCRGAARCRKNPVINPEPGAALISASKRPCPKDRTDAKAPDLYGRTPLSMASISSRAPSVPCRRPSGTNDARFPGNVSVMPGNKVEASVMLAWAIIAPAASWGRLPFGAGCQLLDGGRTHGESSIEPVFPRIRSAGPGRAARRASRNSPKTLGAPAGKASAGVERRKTRQRTSQDGYAEPLSVKIADRDGGSRSRSRPRGMGASASMRIT